MTIAGEVMDEYARYLNILPYAPKRRSLVVAHALRTKEHREYSKTGNHKALVRYVALDLVISALKK